MVSSDHGELQTMGSYFHGDLRTMGSLDHGALRTMVSLDLGELGSWRVRFMKSFRRRGVRVMGT